MRAYIGVTVLGVVGAFFLAVTVAHAITDAMNRTAALLAQDAVH